MENCTVGQLIEMLEFYDPDFVIKVAAQRAWPLTNVVSNVTELESDPGTVWIAIDQTNEDTPYAPEAAWD